MVGIVCADISALSQHKLSQTPCDGTFPSFPLTLLRFRDYKDICVSP